MAPSDCEWLSPKSTRTLLTPAPVADVTVNVTGTPALVAVGFAPKPASEAGLTVTVRALAVATLPEVAVTFAVLVVVSVVVALPFASVVTVEEESVPLSVVNVTGTPETPPPWSLTTLADIVVVPPDEPSVAGCAASVNVFTFAVPILIALFVALAPPE